MTTQPTARYRFGFDIGGTFTDFVLIDSQSGAIHTYKTLTTPEQPAQAVLDGWQTLLHDVGIPGAAVETAIHGTTLITNALIERKGGVTLLITTAGFSDLLDTQREMRYDIYDLHAPPVVHLVPRPLRFEVAERLDGFGNVIEPLQFGGLETMLAQLQAADVVDKVEAVAVSFLHAFLNPDHEQQVGAWLAEHLPHARISLSSDVAPQIREYERMSTTVCNAYVQPLTAHYLHQLQQQLAQHGFEKQLYLMLSSGGITALETATKFPVRLVESGPAAGVLAAIFYGDLTEEQNLVSFDMGGTTAKMSLVRNGAPTMADNFEVARVHRFKRGSGLPVRVPTIELIEIGAGGGSIAHVDELGLLKVGPESAGAAPGPACYGLGGTAPTVTDANLLLGYLNPEYFLGGRMQLDRTAAEAAIRTAIAQPLGLELMAAANGIFQIVNENMISATRVHVAEQGADPRDFKLIAFGGAGPIHAHQIARALKMPGFICPADAGVTSALGFLTAPIAFEYARTYMAEVTADALTAMERIFSELEAEGRQQLVEAGVDAAEIRFARRVDLRHIGQGHEIVMALPYPALDGLDVDETLRPDFYATYAAIYGYAHRHLALEVTTCRLTASGPRPTIKLQEAASRGDRSDNSAASAALKAERPVYFAELHGMVDTPIYDRNRLTVGASFTGPAIVEEENSTAVIGPDSTVVVDAYANLIVTFTVT